ncbi:MAG TPA: dTDP-glucose 4,6-dehydratase [Candidatus Ratteibacteria bacterium]|nr:dTDP-glucose 4,6-dehydratase [Candidatus Ratteibacteria bacterium]
MKIVITGGCGFIGSNFIRYIIKKYPEYEILNIDKLTYAGNPENLGDIVNNKNYKFQKKDICDKSIIDDISAGSFGKNYDVIINFAAESHVDRSIGNPEKFLKTDILGTFNLLEIVRKLNFKRFIQISTDEVYGSIQKGSFDESAPLNPSNPYSASKGSADLLVLSYFKTYKSPVVIIRSTNNYGPYQYPEKFIPLFIINAIRNKKLPLYGDGRNVRDYLFVLDNCKGIDIVLHKGKEGEIYNISAGNEKENIYVANKILEYLGKDESLIEFVKDRPGHDKRYSINSDKIRKLGWKDEVSFEDGLKRTVEWYKENVEWWKKILNRQSYKNYYKKQYRK